MQSKLILLSLGACLLGSTQAQICMTDTNSAQSLLTCMTNIPTATSVNSNMAQASSTACNYAKSILSCYNDNCGGVLPSAASVFLKESSLYCNGNTKAFSTTGTTSASATTTGKSSGMTASTTMSTTASAGANSQSTRTSTSSTSLVSNYSKGVAPQAPTKYVKEIVIVAMAGLIGELVL